jgi:O-antigen/teichoic acid export membrane protein
LRIVFTIFDLYRSERPLSFFTGVGITLAIMSIGFAIPIFVTYFEQGTVPRIPTAILSTGLMLLAFLSVIAGLVLDTVTKGRREMKLLAYLEQRAPGEDWDRRQL